MNSENRSIDIDSIPVPVIAVKADKQNKSHQIVEKNARFRQDLEKMHTGETINAQESAASHVDMAISQIQGDLPASGSEFPARQFLTLVSGMGPINAETEIHYRAAEDDFLIFILNWQYPSGVSNSLSNDPSVFSRILFSLPEFLIFADTDLTIRMISDVAGVWLGEPKNRVIGSKIATWAKLVHNDEIVDWSRRALDTGQQHKANAIWQFDDGQIRHVGISIVPVHAGRDGVAGVYIVARDQTEQIIANQRSRAAEQRFRSILRLSPEAVITTGPKGNIRLFSKGAENIFGYTAAEIIGQPLEILIPERFRAAHQTHIERFKAQEIDHMVMTQRSEIVGLRRNGEEFPASASVSKLDVEQTQLYTVLLHDVTDQKLFEDQLSRAKEEAERANVAKSDFLAGMSHELRTPLNAIIGFSEMITGEVVGPVHNPKYVDYANNIHTAGRHLLSLINDLLDISRLETGDYGHQEEDISLPELVEEVNTMVRGAVDQAGLQYGCRLADNLPLLRGDRRRITQILINVLSNAIKFTPSGKNVTLTAFLRMGRVTFTIVDNGIGISDEDLPRVTDPFVQTHQFDVNRAIESNGVGLGLALVKRMTEMHDGELRIESQQNKGTTVTVQFPEKRSIWGNRSAVRNRDVAAGRNLI